jgi:phosphate transport system substrate-binding protein
MTSQVTWSNPLCAVMAVRSRAAAVMIATLWVGSAAAGDQVRIVGSSTVYPFTAAVAEHLGRTGAAKPPVVEASGTGGGMKLFCAGLGVQQASATNASRRMKKGEFHQCARNGVREIVEVNVGFDGLTVAQSKHATPLNLTLTQLFLALAKEVPDRDGRLIANPYRSWSDIDRTLPNVRIEVLGPPPTSGTRDSLHELFLRKGAERLLPLANLKRLDPTAFDRVWKTLREDGLYVEAGENDNLIVQKIEANRNALGIFGFSFLAENVTRLRGIVLDGVEPEFENIASGRYGGARRIYVYLKKAHIGVIPGLDRFATEYVSSRAIGEEGYLAKKGLVTLPSAEADAVRKTVSDMIPMSSEPLTH